MGLCRSVATTNLCALFLELYVTSKPEEIVKRATQLAERAAAPCLYHSHCSK